MEKRFKRSFPRMEVDFGCWEMEFYLRKRVRNTSILRALTVSPDRRNYFSKIILLRVLEEMLWSESIEETMLDIMQKNEQVFCSEGSPASAALSAAFCAVAVECTVKHLQGNVSSPCFLDAVKRIWLKRVSRLKPSLRRREKRNLLVSEELERWGKDIVTSANDLSVRERLAAADNTKKIAVDKLRFFLIKSWQSLDLSFLVLALENAAEEEQHKETPDDNHVHDTAEEMDPLASCQSDVPPTTTTNDHVHEGETTDRIKLPSPKRKRVSPLKKYEPPNVTISRKRRKWSKLEEDTLEKAVHKFGRSWIEILNAHKDVFVGRTQVNLKDKWRNMELYGR